MFRLLMASFWTLYIVIVLLVEPYALFVHLTFWSIQFMAYAYICLAIGHIKNRDLCCNRRKFESDERPTSFWRLWKFSTLLFYFGLASTWAVTLMYWGVIFPFVKVNDVSYMENYQDQAPDFGWFSFFNHGVPAILMTMDWTFSNM